MIDRDFFNQYQKQLVWFANTRIGRWFLKIREFDISPDIKIEKITPNSFTWVHNDGETITRKTDFRTHAKFAKRINALFSWLPFNAVRRIEIGNQWFLQPKFGLTVSTFYSDAHVETTTVDGRIYSLNKASWALARDATTGDGAEPSVVSENIIAATTGYSVYRSFYLFDTSALPDTDTIDSATFSVYKIDTTAIQNANSAVGELITCNPASNTDLTTADFDAVTFTRGATGIAFSSWGTTAEYKTLTLNATGLSWISKTGISKFALTTDRDVDNSAPTGSNLLPRHYFADQTGTTTDPKLVVTHTAASTFTPKIISC